MWALLKTFPFKGSHNLCGATCIVVVISDESSSAMLSSFQLSYVDVRVQVPNSCGIFQLGPDVCLVAGVLDVLRTVGLRRKAVVLFAFLVTVSTGAFQDSVSLIRTPWYFAFLVCPSYLPWMV